MSRRAESVLTVEGLDGKIKKVLLPDGVRAADINNLNDEDIDVLCTLKEEGRKTRNYFEVRSQLGAIKRLKSRGLVVSVRRGPSYTYDLSPFGYKAFELHLI